MYAINFKKLDSTMFNLKSLSLVFIYSKQEKVHDKIWDGTNTPPKCIVLSAERNCFCYVIPGGAWQAAEPISETVLVGCSVAPGFEFSDFTLIDPNSEDAKLLISAAPEMARYIFP